MTSPTIGSLQLVDILMAALTPILRKVVSLTETLFAFAGHLDRLERGDRERLADYADQIAATLGRAGAALGAKTANSASQPPAADAFRELGRITGYIETILAVLERHLDGRKLGGVKRRLEALDVLAVSEALVDCGLSEVQRRRHAQNLAAAEGYMRALSDGLRA